MDACGCEWECVCVLCLETGDIILHLKIKVVCHVKKKKKKIFAGLFFYRPKVGNGLALFCAGADLYCLQRREPSKCFFVGCIGSATVTLSGNHLRLDQARRKQTQRST